MLDDKDKNKEGLPGYSKGILQTAQERLSSAKEEAFDIGLTISTANAAITSLNSSLAGSGNLVGVLTTQFVEAGKNIQYLDATVNSMEAGMLEAARVNKELMDATGRAYVMSAKEIEGIVAAQSASGVQAEKLLTTFKQQGVALENIPKTIQKVIDTTRALGVNSEAVTKSVTDNLGKINTFNFSNGVEGLTRMAAQAAVVGVDMGRTFAISEKMFNPEKAVELASSMQRLGVATGDLLDPLKLMDLGQNNPQELQNQIVQMSKQFTYFNEQNQKFEILPGAKLQLREVAEELGMNADELARMAIGSADISKKMSEIKFPDMGELPITEDQKTMIANLSELKDGEYKIKIQETVVDQETGERRFTGEVKEKAVSALSESDFESLKLAQTGQMKTLEEISFESLSYEQRSAVASEKMLASMLRGGAVSSRLGVKGAETANFLLSEVAKFTKEMTSTDKGKEFINVSASLLTDFAAGIKEAYADGEIKKDEKKELMEKGKKIDEKFTEVFGKSSEIFKKMVSGISFGAKEIKQAFEDATIVVKDEEKITEKTSEKEPAYLTAQDGKQLMQGIVDATKNTSSNQPTQPVNTSTTNVNQPITNTTTNNQTSNNINTTNNNNTQTSQTTINQSQQATSQLSNQQDLGFAPLVELQGKQLTASEGTLQQIQELNSKIEKGDQELIKLLSDVTLKDFTIDQTNNESIVKPSDLTVADNSQIIPTGQQVTESKLVIQPTPNTLTQNNNMNELAMGIGTTQPQMVNSSFDGKLTIDVNISAPAGTDVNAIKQIVTQVMYDNKVQNEIAQNMMRPKVGEYTPTTGIPT